MPTNRNNAADRRLCVSASGSVLLVFAFNKDYRKIDNWYNPHCKSNVCNIRFINQSIEVVKCEKNSTANEHYNVENTN